MAVKTFWGDFPTVTDEEEEDVIVTEETEETETEEEEPTEETEEDTEEEEESEEEEPKEDEPTEEDISEFESLAASLEEDGLLELSDDSEFDLSKEGFAEMIKESNANLEARLKEEHKQELEELKAKYEEVEHPSIESADVEDDNVAKQLYEAYLKSTGLEEDEIAEKVEEAMDLGKLTKEAKIAKRVLVRAEKKAKAEEAEQIKLQEKEAMREAEVQMKEFRAKLETTESIAGFDIAPKDRKSFADFVTKADKKGMTELKRKASDAESQLKIAYFLWKDLDATQVETKAKTKATKELKKKVSRFKQTGTQGKTVSRKSQKSKPHIPKGMFNFNTEVED